MLNEQETMFIDEFELEIDSNLYPECKKRRDTLIESIKAAFPDKDGVVCILGNFDMYESFVPFIQDATFFYFTGIQEAGCMLTIDIATKKATLYVPHYHETKGQWDASYISVDAKPDQFFVDAIKPLGVQHAGIMLSPRDPKEYFSHFFVEVKKVYDEGGNLFTVMPDKQMSYGTQLFFDVFQESCASASKNIIEINDIVTMMRMKKSEQEIARIYRAIDITITAHEAAIMSIQDDITEREVQAAAEFVFTAQDCVPAFHTIIASGNNATILHYNKNSDAIRKNDLVLIDIGARSDQYCADLSRTYPVSGKFTPRQKALYEIILDVQAHLAEIVRPGYFINNKTQQDRSLQHIALSLFARHGLEKFFTHGIGHHVGLNVHDVAIYTQPLEEGNVITLEPGLYIPAEKIGIRIEDNYWITKSGAVCLSENLPKTVVDIEKMMKYR